jgi:hypothetical protein
MTGGEGCGAQMRDVLYFLPTTNGVLSRSTFLFSFYQPRRSTICGGARQARQHARDPTALRRAAGIAHRRYEKAR